MLSQVSSIIRVQEPQLLNAGIVEVFSLDQFDDVIRDPNIVAAVYRNQDPELRAACSIFQDFCRQVDLKTLYSKEYTSRPENFLVFHNRSKFEGMKNDQMGDLLRRYFKEIGFTKYNQVAADVICDKFIELQKVLDYACTGSTEMQMHIGAASPSAHFHRDLGLLMSLFGPGPVLVSNDLKFEFCKIDKPIPEFHVRNRGVISEWDQVETGPFDLCLVKGAQNLAVSLPDDYSNPGCVHSSPSCGEGGRFFIGRFIELPKHGLLN